MSILVDADTRVMVQGMGRDGTFHAGRMASYGTRVVAAVHPGGGGGEIAGIPVFDTASEAVEETGAGCSVVFVPAQNAPDALSEAAHAGVALVIAVTEGIPVMDTVSVVNEFAGLGTLLLGPNSPGVISPGRASAGIMPGGIFLQGPVGVISRSGTLTYEVVRRLTTAGIGQSTVAGIGGDPVTGLGYVECLRMFDADPLTRAVVLVGEIGGTDEQDAAAWAAENMSKPVVGFIVGGSAPPGRRMGHAGAIVSGPESTAVAKASALRDRGIPVAESVEEIAVLVGRLPGVIG